MHLLPRRTLCHEGTDKIADLNLMMKSVYRFWLHGGVGRAVSSRVVDFLNNCVLWLLTFFAAFVVNWEVALRCTEATCDGVDLMQSPSLGNVAGAHKLVAIVLISAISAAALRELSNAVEDFHLLREVHVSVCTEIRCDYLTPWHQLMAFFSRERGSAQGYVEVAPMDDVAKPYIGDMSWPDFLHAFCDMVRREKVGFRIVNPKTFDELRAVQYLMKHENYQIALNESRFFEEASARGEACWNDALPWADSYCLDLMLDTLLNQYWTYESDRSERVRAVREVLTKFTVVYIVLYPFIASYFVFKTLVKHVARARSSPSAYLKSSWSTYARLRLRMFNETEHLVDQRLAAASKIVDTMMAKLTPPSQLMRFAHRCSSTVAFVVLAVSLLNMALLTSGDFFGRNLLWWLSTALIVYSATEPGETAQCKEYVYKVDLERLRRHLQFAAPEWYYSGATWVDSIGQFYSPHVKQLAESVAKTLLMPVTLVRMTLDRSSVERFVDAVDAISAKAHGLTMCRGAAFGFEQLGPDDCQPDGGAAAVGVELQAVRDTDMPDVQGKEIDSLVSFAATYPKWASYRRSVAASTVDGVGGQPCPRATLTIIDRVTAFMEEEAPGGYRLDECGEAEDVVARARIACSGHRGAAEGLPVFAPMEVATSSVLSLNSVQRSMYSVSRFHATAAAATHENADRAPLRNTGYGGV
jgi:hypothetical protein